MYEHIWLYIRIYSHILYRRLGEWGRQHTPTGRSFSFSCVRAGGRAGDQWMDVRSRFRENSVPYVFPFSLFAFSVVPFSLWTDLSDAVDSANFLWLRYEFLVNSRDVQWVLNELKVSSYDSRRALSEFLVSSSEFEWFLNEFLVSSSEFKSFLKEFLVSS